MAFERCGGICSKHQILITDTKFLRHKVYFFPIIPELFFILFVTYYSQIIPGIISSGLISIPEILFSEQKYLTDDVT